MELYLNKSEVENDEEKINIIQETQKLKPVIIYGLLASIVMTILAFLPIYNVNNQKYTLIQIIIYFIKLLFTIFSTNSGYSILYFPIWSYFWFYISIYTIVHFFRAFKLIDCLQDKQYIIAQTLCKSYFRLLKTIILVMCFHIILNLFEKIPIPQFGITSKIYILSYGIIAIIGIIIYSICGKKIELLKVNKNYQTVNRTKFIIFTILTFVFLFTTNFAISYIKSTSSVFSEINIIKINFSPLKTNELYSFNYLFANKEMSKEMSLAKFYNILTLYFNSKIILSQWIETAYRLVLPLGNELSQDYYYYSVEEFSIKYIQGKKNNAYHTASVSFSLTILLFFNIVNNLIYNYETIVNNLIIYPILTISLIIAIIVYKIIKKKNKPQKQNTNSNETDTKNNNTL